MKKQLVNFDFNGNAVRVHVDKDWVIWFVAVDVCKALEIANARDAVSSLDADEKKLVDFGCVGKGDGSKDKRKINVVNESGMYSLVLTSHKPEAKKFKKWITFEVLPKIRKTGKYDLDGGVKEPEVPEGYVVMSYLNPIEVKTYRLDELVRCDKSREN